MPTKTHLFNGLSMASGIGHVKMAELNHGKHGHPVQRFFVFAAGYLHGVQFSKVERNTNIPKNNRMLKCWDGRYEKIVRERL